MSKPTEERKILLNSGQVESKNLMDMLAIDFKLLLANILPNFNYPDMPKKVGIVKRLEIIAEELDSQFGFDIFDKICNHQSDTVRAFACYLVGKQNWSFEEKLKMMRSFANDDHFGVREWAWLAIRPDFVKDLQNSIKLLIPWTKDNSENIRRFASELSRPRGVWTSYIKQLQQNPELGLPIISPLKSDSAKYVQLSVGNWLNDAGKDNPNWVISLCDKWQKTSPCKETEKICKRALRNLK